MIEENQPQKPLNVGELARTLNRPLAPLSKPSSPQAERNKDLAGKELALIADLKGSHAFEWFQTVCLDTQFKKWRDLLHSPDTASRRTLAGFICAQEIARWLLSRELEHRKLLNPEDSGLREIREKLDKYQ